MISSNGTLTVHGVRKADSGLYGCIAGNMAGLARAQVVVSVSGKLVRINILCICDIKK